MILIFQPICKKASLSRGGKGWSFYFAHKRKYVLQCIHTNYLMSGKFFILVQINILFAHRSIMKPHYFFIFGGIVGNRTQFISLYNRLQILLWKPHDVKCGQFFRTEWGKNGFVNISIIERFNDCCKIFKPISKMQLWF